VFDSARQVLKGEDIQGVGQLEWLNHGPYLLSVWPKTHDFLSQHHLKD